MYCKQCGKRLGEGEICADCVGTDNIFCELCGGELHDGSGFCATCGAVVHTEDAPDKYTSNRKRITAGLLGVFLGGIGAHSFYLGNKKKGIIQIVVTVLTAGAGLLWGFSEGIMILSGVTRIDSSGAKLQG